MVSMLLKDLRLIVRDRWVVLLSMLVPIAVISVIAAALLGDDSGTRLSIAVVDEDHGAVAAAFKTALSDHAEVVELTRDGAAHYVRDRNRAPLAIVFPPQLSDNYRRGKPSDVLLLTDPAQETALRAAKILLLLMEKKAGSAINPLNRQLIVLAEQNLTGNRQAVTPFEQNLPGFALMFVLVAVIFGTSMALHDEHDWRTLSRLLIAPASFNALVLGKLAARFVVGVVQFLLLLLWARFAFGVSLGSSPAAVIVLACGVVFATVATGLVVAGLTGSRQQVQPLGLALVIALSGLGGLWWPPSMGPQWMESVSPAFYTTWAMRGLNDLVLRNRGMPAVGVPVAVLALYGAVLMAVGLMLFRVRAGVRPATVQES
jgi:ABC-2 type transport system permease protein